VATDVMVTPSYDDAAGWPVLLPLSAVPALREVSPERMPSDVLNDLFDGGLQEARLQLGDPGVQFDRETPRSSLPAYTGPVEPAGGHVHEWGATIADQGDDGPLEGPALAPYGQASALDPEQPG
jgi:hypothetical protein